MPILSPKQSVFDSWGRAVKTSSPLLDWIREAQSLENYRHKCFACNYLSSEVRYNLVFL